MDPYVDLFQDHGGSMIMLAKGNRSQQVTDACKKHGGFYVHKPRILILIWKRRRCCSV